MKRLNGMYGPNFIIKNSETIISKPGDFVSLKILDSVNQSTTKIRVPFFQLEVYKEEHSITSYYLVFLFGKSHLSLVEVDYEDFIITLPKDETNFTPDILYMHISSGLGDISDILNRLGDLLTQKEEEFIQFSIKFIEIVKRSSISKDRNINSIGYYLAKIILSLSKDKRTLTSILKSGISRTDATKEEILPICIEIASRFYDYTGHSKKTLYNDLFHSREIEKNSGCKVLLDIKYFKKIYIIKYNLNDIKEDMIQNRLYYCYVSEFPVIYTEGEEEKADYNNITKDELLIRISEKLRFLDEFIYFEKKRGDINCRYSPSLTPIELTKELSNIVLNPRGNLGTLKESNARRREIIGILKKSYDYIQAMNYRSAYNSDMLPEFTRSALKPKATTWSKGKPEDYDEDSFIRMAELLDEEILYVKAKSIIRQYL